MRALVSLLLIATVAACGSEPETASSWPAPAKDAITKVTESGPVKATVQVWPAKPTLGDPLWLWLTVESAPAVTVTLPMDFEALGRFTVRGWDKEERRRGDGGRIQVQRYELTLPSSGKHRLPPLRMTLVDGRPGTASAAGSDSGSASVPVPGSGSASGSASVPAPATAPIELLTEEIPIDVAPVLSAKTSAELRPALGVLSPEVGRRPWWPYALGAVAAGLIAILAVLGVRRMRAAREVRKRVSAYDAAMARLAALEGRGAPDAASADVWFVELSSLVRGYLEVRFALRAPELTTEEFLQVARSAAELSPAQREQLVAFLERCDRVKFAGYRPDADESLATLRAARSFVEETRVAAVAPPEAVAQPRAAA